MEEVKDEYAVPYKLCFRMDANFKLGEEIAGSCEKELSLAKTAAAANFFTKALNTNAEKDMLILEAAISANVKLSFYLLVPA